MIMFPVQKDKGVVTGATMYMYTDRDTDVARVRVGMAVPESPPEIVQDGRFLQVPRNQHIEGFVKSCP